MSLTSEKRLVLVAAWGFVLTGAVLVSQRTLLADETKTADNSSSPCQLRLELRGKMPFLDKIPLVKYFVQPPAEQTALDSSERFERIGLDFDLLPGHMVAFLPNGERQVICTETGCSACPQQNACVDPRVANQSCPACVEWQCATRTDAPTAIAIRKVKPVQACVELQHACEDHPVCEQLAAIRAENAALSAAHQANETLNQARDELFEAMVEVHVERAKLESRLELFAERDRLREQMLELQSENIRLKAAAELAEAQHKVMAQSLETSLENERLKLRVAELEQRGSAAPTAKRTAKKNTQLK